MFSPHHKYLSSAAAKRILSCWRSFIPSSQASRVFVCGNWSWTEGNPSGWAAGDLKPHKCGSSLLFTYWTVESGGGAKEIITMGWGGRKSLCSCGVVGRTVKVAAVAALKSQALKLLDPKSSVYELSTWGNKRKQSKQCRKWKNNVLSGVFVSTAHYNRTQTHAKRVKYIN